MNHSVDECAKSLSLVCRVNIQSKTICATKGSLGLKRLSQVDYLKNQEGWNFCWETPKEENSKKSKKRKEVLAA